MKGNDKEKEDLIDKLKANGYINKSHKNNKGSRSIVENIKGKETMEGHDCLHAKGAWQINASRLMISI